MSLAMAMLKGVTFESVRIGSKFCCVPQTWKSNEGASKSACFLNHLRHLTGVRKREGLYRFFFLPPEVSLVSPSIDQAGSSTHLIKSELLEEGKFFHLILFFFFP